MNARVVAAEPGTHDRQAGGGVRGAAHGGDAIKLGLREADCTIGVRVKMPKSEADTAAVQCWLPNC